MQMIVQMAQTGLKWQRLGVWLRSCPVYTDRNSEIPEASVKSLLSVQVPHVWIWSVQNYLPSGCCVITKPPVTNARRRWRCGFAGDKQRSSWGNIDRKRPAGTLSGVGLPLAFLCQESLNGTAAPAWIKLFLLAVITSGTYDMLSSGCITSWRESSVFDINGGKLQHMTAQQQRWAAL